ncbi:hypothetical protein [Leptotrichia massiliensis]|uniref:hypothetical protein n=1 Tax=Leptotrichia massiliensis TaxID=1852388 RepID=UPI0028ECF2C0|nr:hypothetical protein [Leptotrichia massiliensis]
MALEITRSEAEGILSWIPRLTYNEKNAEIAENYYFGYLKGGGMLEGANINIEFWKRIERTIQVNTRIEYINMPQDSKRYYWRIYEELKLKGIKIKIQKKNALTDKITQEREIISKDEIELAIDFFRGEYNKKATRHNERASIILSFFDLPDGPIKSYFINQIVSKNILSRNDEVFFEIIKAFLISKFKDLNPLHNEIGNYNKKKKDRENRFEKIKIVIKKIRDICLLIAK